MTAYEYLNTSMNQLATVVYNASQSNSITKDMMLDTIVTMLNDYNRAVQKEDNIQVTDWRKKI